MAKQRGPSEAVFDAADLLLAPWRWLTAPSFQGLERIPLDRPILLVGNHTLMGVLDVPLMWFGLREKLGLEVHPLGDHLHFQLPLWRDLVSAFGVIEGTRENCRAAMQAGQSLLVFPGGGREVAKRRGEKYKLIWQDRVGFARMAIEAGYTIVPFASVGADDCWDIVLDGDDLLRSPLGGVVRALIPRLDLLPPLVRGIGLSPLPRPERFYFHFGDPIPTDTERYHGREEDVASCAALRDEVRRAVESGLELLLELRENDPDRNLRSRLLRRLLG